MKTLVVGDLHGKWELADKAIATPYNVVFIGDYLDSFDRSPEDCVRTLQTVMHHAEHHPEQCTALVGNHERSYIYEEMCSGWRHDTNMLVQSIGVDYIKSVLKDYVFCEGFLISHAGVSQLLLDDLNLTLQDYLAAGLFNQIGYVRGGNDETGGLYWCDWRYEFEPIEDQPQIVGHTAHQGGVLQKGNSYNIDCLDWDQEFLLIEDGVAEIIKVQDL